RQVRLQRVGPATRSDYQDLVAVEEPMEVRVNGASFAVIMRTPGHDRELAAGFLLAEDVIRGSQELATIEYCEDADDEGRDNTLNVTVVGEAVERLLTRLGERRQVMMTASCGLCGRRTIESLRSRVPFADGQWVVPPQVVRGLPHTLRQAQSVFETTGGLHAAGLFSLEGALHVMAEDVGRHNAVDKVIGRRLLEDALPLDRSMLVVSGRTSFELVQKALLAGVPLIAAVSAPSSLAIELAEESGVTLCGFVRGDTFNVYANPQRIA
ncbi:MAG: formate dehydrogenase accessory sulfurtransferase FdhD, partial [Vicinamibacterales bacterium]